MTEAQAKEKRKWWCLKAALIARYGTLSAAAAAMKCSTNGFRHASKGICPGVAKKLVKHGFMQPEENAA